MSSGRDRAAGTPTPVTGTLRGARAAGMVATMALVLAACGSGPAASPADTSPASAPSLSLDALPFPSDAPVTPAPPLTGSALFDRVVTDTKQLTSYHVVFRGAGAAGPLNIDLHVAGTDATGAVNLAGSAGSVIMVGGELYVQGAALAAFITGQPAAAVGSSWVHLAGGSLRAVSTLSDPASLAGCLRSAGGAVAQDSSQQAAGHTVVQLSLRAKNGDPVASQLVVTSDGVPEMMHWSLLTGAVGGPPDCRYDGAQAPGPTGVLELSELGVPVAISPPPSPVELAFPAPVG